MGQGDRQGAERQAGRQGGRKCSTATGDHEGCSGLIAGQGVTAAQVQPSLPPLPRRAPAEQLLRLLAPAAQLAANQPAPLAGHQPVLPLVEPDPETWSLHLLPGGPAGEPEEPNPNTSLRLAVRHWAQQHRGGRVGKYSSMWSVRNGLARTVTDHCLLCTLCSHKQGVRCRFTGRWNRTQPRQNLACRTADEAAKKVAREMAPLERLVLGDVAREMAGRGIPHPKAPRLRRLVQDIRERRLCVSHFAVRPRPRGKGRTWIAEFHWKATHLLQDPFLHVCEVAAGPRVAWLCLVCEGLLD